MLDKYQTEQPVAYKVLTTALNNATFSHAYLFETNGYEKSNELIMSFTKLLLCPNKHKCDNCTQCQTIDDGNFSELRILYPDGQWIKKEQLIELQNEFSKKVVIGNKKVYIINSAEKMNSSSANSILKFLEEPEEGIVAILVTQNKYQVLNTIVSRCQLISLNNVVQEENILQTIYSFLNLENPIIDDEEKLNQAVQFVNFYEKNHRKALLYMNSMWHTNFSDNQKIQFGLISMLFYYKAILDYQLQKKCLNFIHYEKDIEMIASKNSVNQIINKIEKITEAFKKISYNINSSLLMDKLIIEMEEVK